MRLAHRDLDSIIHACIKASAISDEDATKEQTQAIHKFADKHGRKIADNMLKEFIAFDKEVDKAITDKVKWLPGARKEPAVLHSITVYVEEIKKQYTLAEPVEFKWRVWDLCDRHNVYLNYTNDSLIGLKFKFSEPLDTLVPECAQDLQAVREACRKVKEIEDKNDSIAGQIKDVLKACVTMRQVLKVMPGAVHFMPVSVQRKYQSYLTAKRERPAKGSVAIDENAEEQLKDINDKLTLKAFMSNLPALQK